MQEHILEKLRWNKYGINIDEALLKYLRYVDDIVSIRDEKYEQQKLIEEVNREMSKRSVKMNLYETKIIYIKREAKHYHRSRKNKSSNRIHILGPNNKTQATQ